MPSRIKRTWRFFISTLLCVLVCPTVSLAMPTDIKGHWAEATISEWLDRGLINGYPDGSFRPDALITRAEFMALVNRAFGFQEQSVIDFVDVSPDSWYAEAVGKAKAVGYIAGYEDGTIRPVNPIDRQEAAIIIKKIKNLPESAAGPGDFSDSCAIPAWSKGAVGALVEAGVMNGYPDGSFRPTNPVNRAEAVTVLDKTLKYQETLFNKPGVYGPLSGVSIIEGNVTITADGVTLQNLVIMGNLTIARGVGEGNVILKKITVKGKTDILGGGENSISIIDSNLPAVMIDKANNQIRVVASGSTQISEVIAGSGVRLEEIGLTGAGFRDVVVAAKEGNQIVLVGSFEKINVVDQGVTIDVPLGSTVQNLAVEPKFNLIGDGMVRTAEIKAGSVVWQTHWSELSTVSRTGRIDGVINNPAYITVSNDGGITEGGEGLAKLVVTLANDTFISSQVNPTAVWMTGLPAGVAVGAVEYVDETHVRIALTGNSTVDYDTDVVSYVHIVSATLNNGGGEVLASITFPATVEPALAAPTNPVVDDKEDTFGWTYNGSQNLAGDYEFSLNSGATWTTCTANPQPGIAGDYDAGEVRVRAKATLRNPASQGLESNQRFTQSAPYFTILYDGEIREGFEDSRGFTAILMNSVFLSEQINTANVSMIEGPAGISVGSVKYLDPTTIKITFSGNSTADYDGSLVRAKIRVAAEAISSGQEGMVSIELVPINEPALGQPTDPVVNDTADTFGWTNNGVQIQPGDYEYSLDNGNTWTTCTANPQPGITGSYAAGVVQVRAKATLREPASSALKSKVPFTLPAPCLKVASDGEIREGAEAGETLTVTLANGAFIQGNINPGNITMAGLPVGVSIDKVQYINPTTITITLDGNSIEDYDAKITAELQVAAAALSGSGDLTTAFDLTATVEPALNPPTAPVVDDQANTFGWTHNGVQIQPEDYEYSLDNGLTWTTCTDNPQPDITGSYAAGTVQVRTKATLRNPASTAVQSNAPFTLAADKLISLTLGIGPGGQGGPVLLAPVSPGDDLNYKATVDQYTYVVQVTPTPAVGNTAVVKYINGEIAPRGEFGPLSTGLNIITVVVSKNGCQDLIYTITLKKD